MGFNSQRNSNSLIALRVRLVEAIGVVLIGSAGELCVKLLYSYSSSGCLLPIVRNKILPVPVVSNRSRSINNLMTFGGS